MLLLGVAVVPMALGALRGARPAMFALAALGVVVLVVAFTVDLPAALDEGLLAVRYEGAEAEPADRLLRRDARRRAAAASAAGCCSCSAGRRPSPDDDEQRPRDGRPCRKALVRREEPDYQR